MSLTSFIKEPDVRKKFAETFPLPKIEINAELKAPPVTKNYSLVGTAFDYLLRFYIKKHNPEAKTNEWVAEIAVQSLGDIGIKLHGVTDRNSVTDQFNKLEDTLENTIKNAKEIYQKYLDDGVLSDDVLEIAIRLAKIDPIYRAGYIDPNIDVVDEGDIQDLKNLISIVQPNIFKAKGLCLLDPTFGKASALVGGADVDLVIDDMIIDIKTTKNFELQRDYFNQLIGYYSLYRIAGIDGMPPNHEIKRIGIYFSRHGYLHLLNVQEIINENSFSKFIEWFIKRADMGV